MSKEIRHNNKIHEIENQKHPMNHSTHDHENHMTHEKHENEHHTHHENHKQHDHHKQMVEDFKKDFGFHSF